MKKFFLLIEIFVGTLMFADLPNDAALESNTKTVLEWQDDNDTATVKRGWQDSINYCESLTLSNHSDWRLPNINELKSIIDRERMLPALLSTCQHIGIENNFGYWSSTSLKGEESEGWYVSFSYGYVYHQSKEKEYYVRCVRNRE